MKYQAGYSKTETAQCKGCFKIIDQKNILRMVTLQKARTFDGNLKKFYHPECFFIRFSPKSESNIDGFGLLRNEDMELIRTKLSKVTFEDNLHLFSLSKPNTKKATRKHARLRKCDPSENDQQEQPPEKQMKAEILCRSDEAKQNDKYHTLRDKVKRINESFLRDILYKDRLLDHVTDVILFGALEPCDENNCAGKFVFDGNSTYRCNSILSVHGLCDKTKKNPKRKRVTISSILLQEYPFLNIEIDPNGRILPDSPEPKRSTRRSRTEETIDSPSSSQMILKNDGVVEPNSGLQNNTHVYSENGVFFSETLTNVNLNVRRDKNSFYKLQLLESDDQNSIKYYVYQSWGRIKTDRNDRKITPFSDLQAAKKLFNSVFKQKTSNEFGSSFKKQYGKYDRLQITNDEAKIAYKLVKSEILPESIQTLLRLMIDKSIMDDLLVKFDLDLNKMPLGKIEHSSIIKAYNILKDIKSMNANSTRRAKITEASNRFYSLIPHNVSCDDVIDSPDLWNKKVELLTVLYQTKFNYEFFHQYSGKDADILEAFYGKLKTHIEPLQNFEERQIIEQYVRDTQMHNNLEIEEIYQINRKHAELGYTKYESLPNRKLLWHGSRIPHFASILANGLQIAPPEAIVIGCMFGKGLYFSDVIANAVQYCYPNQTNDNGLIFLCEVALGDSVLCTDAENIEELPADKHSVHGVGKISSSSHILLNESIVPTGEPIEHAEIETPLDYNEYVVYNNEQVKIKYLIWFKSCGPSRRF